MLHQRFSTEAPERRLARGQDRAKSYSILLAPGFSLVSLGGFTQCLHLANKLSGKSIFDWELHSEDGAPVRSSCGLHVDVRTRRPDPRDIDCLLVISARNQKIGRQLSGWIKTATRHGCVLGALDGAVIALADAGCMEHGSRWSVHWRQFSAMQECYPDQEFRRTPFTQGKNTFSGIGATSGVDIALGEIQAKLGMEFALRCADELNYSAQYKFQSLSSDRHPALASIDNETLRDVVEEMELAIEDTPSAEYFAHFAGISIRQLERLFQQHLNQSPMRFFLSLRLDHATGLLLQTNMSVAEIAICCGFGSSTHFNKRFKESFGVNATRFRAENTV